MSIYMVPIYVEREDGTEVEFEAEVEISGWDRPATYNDPAEYAEAEVTEIRDAAGNVVDPKDWAKHGLTENLIERAEEAAFEKAADAPPPCRCGEHCRC